MTSRAVCSGPNPRWMPPSPFEDCGIGTDWQRLIGGAPVRLVAFQFIYTTTDMPCAAPLAESLCAWVEAVRLGVLPRNAATSRLDEIRLEDLVLGLLDLDCDEAARLASLSGSGPSFERCAERFHGTLQEAIRQLRLFKLFTRTHDDELHRSICPAAYDERTGEHYPEEMARWRAAFRAMAPEQQMLTTTIVWMYRHGPDRIWLRRISCTWRASEALYYMQDSGCLALWLKLVARYPG